MDQRLQRSPASPCRIRHVRYAAAVAVAGLLAALSPGVPAQADAPAAPPALRPVNDDFADRIRLPATGGPLTGTTAHATDQPDGPDACQPWGSSALPRIAQQSLWWSYASPLGGPVRLRPVPDVTSEDANLHEVTAFRGTDLASLQPVAQMVFVCQVWNRGLGECEVGSWMLDFVAQPGIAYPIRVSSCTLPGLVAPTAFNLSLAGPERVRVVLRGPDTVHVGDRVTVVAEVILPAGMAEGAVQFDTSDRPLQYDRFPPEWLADGRASFTFVPTVTDDITISAEYLGSAADPAVPAVPLAITVLPPRVSAPFMGGGVIFGTSPACAPALGPGVWPVRLRYSPGELEGMPSGLAVAWPAGSEHLALWAPLLPSGDFLGGAGRGTWTRFVFYPLRPLLRVVQRQITLPAGGTDIAAAQELVLRLRVQHFAAVAGCAVTIAGVLRRS
jgi:hypothetical protein